jgi:uncharacterized membrane protein YdjX (TVP38/TMEM64 family)
MLLGTLWLQSETEVLAAVLDGATLRDEILRLGAWGPIAIIGLMTLAVVASPIPSAPIALTAGVAYGHTWGTIYVLIGAEMGALIAFGIARFLGYEAIQRWFGDRLAFRHPRSQHALMGIVFVSRLMPFLSFDLISYAAGLTPLKLWRFAIATLAGIVPASFLLAHFGGELASGDAAKLAGVILVLGAISIIPIAVRFLRSKKSHSATEAKPARGRENPRPKTPLQRGEW